MAAIETPTSTRLSADERGALHVRHQAAMSILRAEPGISDEERWDLLAAVIWPSDPLLGLTCPTSSATEPS